MNRSYHSFTTPEADNPMLDVHPPHHPTRTWTDFFIHIATIVIGLCIAVGLEQTVEFFHHQHQLHEAREQIHAELLSNDSVIQDNLGLLEEASQRLRRNTAALRVPSIAAQAKGAELNYAWNLSDGNRVAWDTANADGAVALMPTLEAQEDARLYRQGDHATQACLTYIAGDEIARATAQRADTVDGLSLLDRQQLLAATSDALGKLMLCKVQLASADTMLKESFNHAER